MTSLSNYIDWFELIGVIPQSERSPCFVDLVFKEVLPKWAADTEEKFVQVIDSNDRIIDFKKIDHFAQTVITLPDNKLFPKSARVGDTALYHIQLEPFIDLENFEIVSGYQSTCENALGDENIHKLRANPFFALSLAQYVGDKFLETEFAKCAVELLRMTNRDLAAGWLAKRSLSQEARAAANNTFSTYDEILDGDDEKIELRHFKVAVLNTVRHRTIVPRYYMCGDILISMHIVGVEYMFKNRLDPYDVIVAPYSNFLNGEDFSNICPIAVYPHPPSPRQAFFCHGVYAVLHDGVEDLANEIVKTVQRHAAERQSAFMFEKRNSRVLGM